MTASRLKLDEYELGRKDVRDQSPRSGRSRATRATPLRHLHCQRCRLDRTDGLVLVVGSVAFKDYVRRTATIYGEQSRALVDGGVDRALARDDARSARAQSRDRRYRSCSRSRNAARSDSSVLTLLTEGRMLLARHSARLLRRAADRRHLGRIVRRGLQTARLRALSRGKLTLLRQRPSERGTAAEFRKGETIYPESAHEASRANWRISPRNFTSISSWLRHDACLHARKAVESIGFAAKRIVPRDLEGNGRRRCRLLRRPWNTRNTCSSENGSAVKDRANRSVCCSRDNYDEIMLVAREQVGPGAACADFSCRAVHRAHRRRRANARRLAQSIEVPLMIDSTNDASCKSRSRISPDARS